MALPAPEKKPASKLKDAFAKIFSKSPRWGAFASLILIAAGIVFLLNYAANVMFVQNPVLPEEKLEPAVLGRSMPESAPVRLKIPAINVDAGFVELGLKANNEIEIPKSTQEVGWYKFGPTPGELGHAIVLGHVDSYLGPGVFFTLGQLEPGDTIRVERQDGSVSVFRVDKLERYPQKNFPTELVYGDINYAGLRLIVYASLVDSEGSVTLTSTDTL